MSNFQKLWANHPNIKGDAPILDRKVYENQCAINLSAALTRAGVPMNGFRGTLSWQKGAPKYAIRAQELADWLCTTFPRLPTRFEKVSPSEFSKKISQKRGIIFFQNYWGPGKQGDHIDLWNGARLTDWFTWVRIHARIGSFGVHSFTAMSDFENADAVWFWGLS